MTVAYWLIVSKESGLALDLDGGNTSPGTLVVLAQKNPQTITQHWYIDEQTPTIRNRSNDLGLDLSADGQFIVAVSDKNSLNQSWERKGQSIANSHHKDDVANILDNEQKPGTRIVRSHSSAAKHKHWEWEDALNPPEEKSPKHDDKDKPPKDDQKDKSPKQDRKGKPPKDDQKDKPPKDDQKDKSPKQDRKDKPPKDDQKDKPPKDDQKDKPPKQDQKDKPPKDDHQGEPPKDDQDKPPKDDQKDKPPKDDQKDKPPKDDHQGEPPKDDQKDKPPEQDPKENPPDQDKTSSLKVDQKTQCFYLISQMNGLALDLKGEASSPGTPVVTAGRTGKASQQWYEDSDTGTIRNKLNDLCMDAIEDTTRNLNLIVVDSYQANKANQQWTLDVERHVIFNRESPSDVVDIYNSCPDHGADVIKYKMTGESNQRWNFESVDRQGPSTTEPPVTATTEPPVTATTEPPVTATTEPPVTATTEPPVTGQPIPDKEKPAGEGSTKPPDEKEKEKEKEILPGMIDALGEKIPLLPQTINGIKKSKPFITCKRLVTAVVSVASVIALVLSVVSFLKGGLLPGGLSGLTNIIHLPPSLQSALASVAGVNAPESDAVAKKKSNATDAQSSQNWTDSARRNQSIFMKSGPREQFFIVSEMNGKVVTIKDGNPDVGAEVIMKSKNLTNPTGQLWYSDKEGYIHSALNELLITAKFNGTARMAPISKDLGSHWKFQNKLIVNEAGEVLDVRFHSKSEGASLTAFKYHGTANERWRKETFKKRPV